MTITIHPATTHADVKVTDPSGTVRTLTATTTIDPAAPGHWVITADPSTTGGDTYYPAIQTTSVTLAADAQGTVLVTYDQVVADTTTVVTPGTLDTLAALGTPGEYQATVTDPDHCVAVGATLVVGPGLADPTGLLLVVTAVTSAATPETVTGTQGSIMDIGPEGDVTVQSTPSTDVRGDQALAGESGSDHPRTTVPPEETIDSPIKCDEGATATLTGSVSINAQENLQIKWGGILSLGTFTAKATFSGTEKLTVKAEVEAETTCTLTTVVPSKPIPLGMFDVQVGPVPVEITPV